jgi:hypothetical protein
MSRLSYVMLTETSPPGLERNLDQLQHDHHRLRECCEFLPQPKVLRNINMTMHTPKLQFADAKEQEDLPREILIGSDNYRKIVKDSPPLRISTSVMILPSELGLITSGNPSGILVILAAVRFLHLEKPGPLPETDIKRFGIWILSVLQPTRTNCVYQGLDCSPRLSRLFPNRGQS